MDKLTKNGLLKVFIGAVLIFTGVAVSNEGLKQLGKKMISLD